MNQVEVLKAKVETLERQVEALQDRLARLSRASLRVSESLDVNTVLQEVVENACALTGARYGVITALDDSGQVPGFVTAGFSPEEQRQLADFPGRWELYKYLRELPEPLKLRDLTAHIRELGIPGDLPGDYGSYTTFLGAPIRHRGTHVGNFFLGGKEASREFDGEDEEILLLFASQAATAIANALKHRDEQRAKADLEALVDTAPVGVVVFAARTGEVLTLNREAQRIVGALCETDMPVEDLLHVLTVRWTDGHEISLKEFPLAKALGTATTVRAEEIVLEVPDGRSVTTLVNATPIHAEGGEPDSVVVTLQDMTPLEELVRMRAEFLGMVSHELRAPLASIAGSASTVLNESAQLDPAEMIQFFRIVSEQADLMRSLIRDLLDVGRIEAGTLSVAPQPASLTGLVDQARSTFASGGGRHAIEIDLPPELPRVMADRRRIVQVLGNLVSNAARHSPDSSPIRISAAIKGAQVAVTVADEGAGVVPERLPLLFRKFVRSKGGKPEHGLRGSGLGLAISRGLVEAHGGRIWADSEGPGLGTRFTFTIPAVEPVGEDLAGAGPEVRKAASGRTRVLVVDDDPITLRFVRVALAEAGFDPVLTGDPDEVVGLIRTSRPDLVLLDLVLPGVDGIELMSQVPALADIPVIFVSGYGRDETIARALQAGAIDYIVKPFSPTELVARVSVALRERRASPEPYRLGDLEVDYAERRVSVADQPVRLTATEYELLRELSVNAGRVLTYDTLLRRVWHEPEGRDSRLVRPFVKTLRKKLGDDAKAPSYIFTEPRVGYRMPKPNSR